MTPRIVLSPVLELSAKGCSRAAVCRFQADKETLSEVSEAIGITIMRKSYTITFSQIGKLCARFSNNYDESINLA
jgi:hypothetical protein